MNTLIIASILLSCFGYISCQSLFGLPAFAKAVNSTNGTTVAFATASNNNGTAKVNSSTPVNKTAVSSLFGIISGLSDSMLNSSGHEIGAIATNTTISTNITDGTNEIDIPEQVESSSSKVFTAVHVSSNSEDAFMYSFNFLCSSTLFTIYVFYAFINL